jgi:hypothetical protein
MTIGRVDTLTSGERKALSLLERERHSHSGERDCTAYGTSYAYVRSYCELSVCIAHTLVMSPVRQQGVRKLHPGVEEEPCSRAHTEEELNVYSCHSVRTSAGQRERQVKKGYVYYARPGPDGPSPPCVSAMMRMLNPMLFMAKSIKE